MTLNLSITVYSPVSNISCENISEWRFRNQKESDAQVLRSSNFGQHRYTAGLVLLHWLP